MFGPLGFQEVLFILVLALLIFGPRRLPEIGRTVGKGMAQFRKASNDLRRSIESEIALEEEPPRRAGPHVAPRLPPPAAAEARQRDETETAPSSAEDPAGRSEPN